MKRACLVLLLSSCFNPDDLIPIHGSAQPGQRVELARAPFCLREMKTFKETNAADDGTFVFEVFRAQAQHLGNSSSYCLRTRTRFPSGVRAEADIGSLDTAAQLPPFVDWRPHFTYDAGTFQFDGVDAGSEFPAHHSAEMTCSDGGVLWRQSELKFGIDGTRLEPLNVDERLLREFPGVVKLEARYGERFDYSWVPSALEMTSVLTRAADEVAFETSNAPPSRDMPCDEVPSPCPLTDGLVEDALLPRGTNVLTIRFATPLTPSLLVARELLVFGEPDQRFLADGGVVVVPSMRVTGLSSGGEEVELARHDLFIDPAQGYSPLPDGGFVVPGSNFAVPLDAGVSFTGIRLRASSFHRVREVSVF